MKKIILVLFVFLTACAEFGGMSYDPTLHMQEATALVSARNTLSACDTKIGTLSHLTQLKNNIDVIHEYHSHIDGSPQLELVITNTKEIVDSMVVRYNSGDVPATYCKIKSELIITSINSMMNITGRKQ